MKDPMVDRTKRHKLIDVITIAICVVICGANGLDRCRVVRQVEARMAEYLLGNCAMGYHLTTHSGECSQCWT